MLSTAAASMGGDRPSTNFRPGLDSRGVCTFRAFQKIADAPTAKAHRASNPHTPTHHSTCGRSAATAAAAKAVIPIVTPPHPGTAVNEAALSMVSRMNRRSSMACVDMGTGLERRARTGPGHAMPEFIQDVLTHVKYFMVQSRVTCLTASISVVTCKRRCYQVAPDFHENTPNYHDFTPTRNGGAG